MATESRERLIHALDLPSVEEAGARVGQLGDAVQFYKIGLELFASKGCIDFVEWLRNQGKKVFVDLKLYDIPNTVAAAVRQLGQLDVQLTTVHGDDAILEAALREKKDVKILAVTVLSNLGQRDLRDMGIECNLQELVLKRAKRAKFLGCDGVVCAGSEARMVREQLGDGGLIVTPGIRSQGQQDDQKRISSAGEALKNGADYLVVGRPIARSNDPRAEALKIQEEIKNFDSARPGGANPGGTRQEPGLSPVPLAASQAP